MARKTEIYTWRLSRGLKTRLEEAAHREGRSIADLLDQIVGQGLTEVEREPDDGERQRQLHDRAAEFAGCLAGSDRGRAANARTLVRDRLRRRASDAG
jgi:hypothetical protein